MKNEKVMISKNFHCDSVRLILNHTFVEVFPTYNILQVKIKLFPQVELSFFLKAYLFLERMNFLPFSNFSNSETVYPFRKIFLRYCTTFSRVDNL